MNSDQVLRKQLVSFLNERNAHVNLRDVLDTFPVEHINSRIAHVEYTPWELLEHMRLTQRDIINFIKDSNYQAPEWPGGYWPIKKIGDTSDWNESLKQYYDDLEHVTEIVQNEEIDLTESMPAGEKYNVFREILIVIDHNAHHLGQMVLFRKNFKSWP